ncbi:MAG: hypothetical protein KDI79_19175 [Anaerolineae bacterium]|nr:hypothetical protein [Anaerolineae bacterium]
MSISSNQRKFASSQLGIAVIFSTAFVGLTVLLCAGLIVTRKQSMQALPAQFDESWSARQTIPASKAIDNDRSTLILFYPVEVCRRRYCLTLEAVEAKLDPNTLQTVNLVSVPVYAIPMKVDGDEPMLPLLGWNVDAVEHHIDWLPELSETDYGWGLESPAVVLVAPDSAVLYRGDEYFTLDELDPYLEPSRLNDDRLLAGNQ